MSAVGMLESRSSIIEKLKHIRKPDDCVEFIYNYRNLLIEALKRMD